MNQGNFLVYIKNIVKKQKIPCIPPLLHDNKHVTDFKKKAELFNCFFINQCSITDNSSELLLKVQSYKLKKN